MKREKKIYKYLTIFDSLRYGTKNKETKREKEKKNCDKSTRNQERERIKKKKKINT